MSSHHSLPSAGSCRSTLANRYLHQSCICCLQSMLSRQLLGASQTESNYSPHLQSPAGDASSLVYLEMAGEASNWSFPTTHLSGFLWKQWNDFEGIQQWWSLWTTIPTWKSMCRASPITPWRTWRSKKATSKVPTSKDEWQQHRGETATPLDEWNPKTTGMSATPQLSFVQWGQQHLPTWVESNSHFRFNRCTLLR